MEIMEFVRRLRYRRCRRKAGERRFEEEAEDLLGNQDVGARAAAMI